MIRPTTIPQTLEELIVEQAIAREALRLSFEQHKKFAVSLKGVQQERTISDTFEQKMTGGTLVNMEKLDMIVGSGGVLSHAPRREQAYKMLLDSFLPEGITQLAVDSIFMMPQLGVLSSVHEKAAIEVFNKDCLIRLGTCIAPVGEGKYGDVMMDYSFKINGKTIQGELKYGELILIKAGYNSHKVELSTKNSFSLGNKKDYLGEIFGGEVGIVLDGRGRPFNFSLSSKDRVERVKDWRISINEYPSRNL